MGNVRALICNRLAPNLEGVEYGTINIDSVEADQVQVAVHAAAFNFPDLLMTEGGYQYKPNVPYVVGMEGAGVITEVGGHVKNYRVGDRVGFNAKTGACAELANLNAQSVWPLPAGFSFEQGAAFHVGALTAWVSLVCRAGLLSGETLLVHGASGGMGLAAVQLGVHLGATVIATGTNESRLHAAAECGARHCFVADDHLRDRVKDVTNGRGADVVFDPVGGDVFDRSLRMIATQGRLLIVGFASGRIAQLPTNIALIKELSVIGVRAGEYGRRHPELGHENEQAILGLANEGVLTPHIGASFAMHDARNALAALRERAHPGKIVVSADAR